MQSDLILTGIKVDDLIERITQLIEKNRVEKITPQVDTALKYLSRVEVAKLLKITLPTLNEWSKVGLLKAYKIGNRVLYKQAEIEDSLTKISSIKYRRGG